MIAKMNMPDLSGLTVDVDALEKTLKSELQRIGQETYDTMKAEIEVGTGASQQALKYYYYDNGDSAKVLILELDPSGSSHHQHWFGAHFQEVGAPNRAKKSWLEKNEKELRRKVRTAIKAALAQAVKGS